MEVSGKMIAGAREDWQAQPVYPELNPDNPNALHASRRRRYNEKQFLRRDRSVPLDDDRTVCAARMDVPLKSGFLISEGPRHFNGVTFGKFDGMVII
jgi:hypothetical protein